MSAAATELTPDFTVPDSDFLLATEGKALLEWEIADTQQAVRFELQQSGGEGFSGSETSAPVSSSTSSSTLSPPWTRYVGPDRATFVSGLAAGDYFFRVRVAGGEGAGGGDPGPWSRPIRVRVEYASLRLVFWLTAIGVVVFLATVAVVLAGHRRVRFFPKA